MRQMLDKQVLIETERQRDKIYAQASARQTYVCTVPELVINKCYDDKPCEDEGVSGDHQLSTETNLFVMSRIQSEPQSHRTSLTFRHSSDPVRVLLTGTKCHNATALRFHHRLQRGEKNLLVHIVFTPHS